MTSRIFVAICCALLGVTTPTLPATIRVPLEEPTIQDGIDAAVGGDTVLVACGTYFEHGIYLGRSGIVLRSEGGDADCVTIDAQQRGQVMYCEDLDSTTRIEGFTITGGYAQQGGGMLCWMASPAIVDCDVAENEAYEGGGGVSSFYGSPSFLRCTFRDNSARGGGALSALGVSTLTGCVFVRNSASEAGGAIAFGSVGRDYPVLQSCTFALNAASNGAGIACRFGAMVLLERSILAFGGGGGAAVSCDGVSAATLTCCDVFGNGGGDWVGCLDGQYGVNGNFAADPIFCGAAMNDFTLHAASPCAPGNSPGGCSLVGALPVGCGVEGVGEGGWVAASGLRVMRNPARVVAELVLEGGGPEVLEILDAQGRLVERVPGSGGRWTWEPGGARPAGVYFARLLGGGDQAAVKFAYMR